MVLIRMLLRGRFFGLRNSRWFGSHRALARTRTSTLSRPSSSSLAGGQRNVIVVVRIHDSDSLPFDVLNERTVCDGLVVLARTDFA